MAKKKGRSSGPLGMKPGSGGNLKLRTKGHVRNKGRAMGHKAKGPTLTGGAGKRGGYPTRKVRV